MGDYTFYVSTSTLSRCYKNKDVINFTDKTNLVSLKLLVSLFEGIRSEERSEEAKRIPILEELPHSENLYERYIGRFN